MRGKKGRVREINEVYLSNNFNKKKGKDWKDGKRGQKNSLKRAWRECGNNNIKKHTVR